MKKYIAIIIFLMCLLPNNVFAATYEMITYDVKIKINENRIADIIEEYNIYFMNDTDEFERIINTKLTTIRPNGTKRTTTSTISNVNVLLNENKVEHKLNKNKIIVPANHKRDMVGKYTISYSYDYGKDTGVGIDELFVELINGNINTNISSINFEIDLPKSIDSSKINFLYNSKLNSNIVDYTINNNIINGYINRNLKSGETVGIYLELPDKYFVGTSDNYNYWIFLLILAPIVTFVIGAIYYKKYKKGNDVEITLNDEIPYGFNSAEIAYLYKGFLKEHDLLTVFISLANKGYLKFIEQDDGYKLDSVNSFKIEKLKDYDGENASEKLLFEKIFQYKDLIDLKDIEYNLFDTLMETKGSIDNKDNYNKIFFETVKIDKKILGLLIIISILTINFNSIHLFTSSYLLIPVIVAVMTFGIYILFVADTNLLVKIILGILLIGLSLYVGIMPLINDIRTLLIYLIGMVIIFLSAYIYKSLPYRTLYGNEVYGKIHSFRRALQIMDNTTLKEKIENNPNYFYDIYPYVYIFEDTGIWIHKAENMIKEYPFWYQTKEVFSLNTFEKFVKNMIFTTTQAMFKRQLTGQSRVHVEYHREKNDEL